jgi:hypothetical protein
VASFTAIGLLAIARHAAHTDICTVTAVQCERGTSAAIAAAAHTTQLAPPSAGASAWRGELHEPECAASQRRPTREAAQRPEQERNGLAPARGLR